MRPTALCATIAISMLLCSRATGQGVVTPALPPGPVQKTLLQLEPRQDVNRLPGSATSLHLIDTPGSYVLTANLTGAASRLIEITAEGVVLDLNGFNLDGGGAAGVTGIFSTKAVVVRRGSLSGFETGIDVPPGSRLESLGLSLCKVAAKGGADFHRCRILGCEQAGEIGSMTECAVAICGSEGAGVAQICSGGSYTRTAFFNNSARRIVTKAAAVRQSTFTGNNGSAQQGAEGQACVDAGSGDPGSGQTALVSDSTAYLNNGFDHGFAVGGLPGGKVSGCTVVESAQFRPNEEGILVGSIKLGVPGSVSRCATAEGAGAGVIIDRGTVSECASVGHDGGALKTGGFLVLHDIDGPVPSQTLISRCAAGQNLGTGIQGAGPLLVRACNASDNERGILGGVNLYQEEGVPVQRTALSRIEACVAGANSQSGIAVGDGSSVVGCVVLGGVSGVSVGPHSMVRSTLASGASGGGISLSGPGGSVDGCVTHANGQAGIDASLASCVAIRDNLSIEDGGATGAAVLIGLASVSRVTGNHVVDPPNIGFRSDAGGSFFGNNSVGYNSTASPATVPYSLQPSDTAPMGSGEDWGNLDLDRDP